VSRITTLLFDVFETLLVNRRWQWDATFEAICRSQGLPIDPDRLHREWTAHEGAFREARVNLEDPSISPPFRSYYEAWRDCFRLAFGRLDLPGDADAATRTAVQALTEREPYADALEALPSIQARWRTGILSNADDAFLLPPLRRHGLRFEVVLSSEEARVYKPHPAAFQQALDLLGADASETVYVGDSPHDDILGAKLTGMRVAWLNRDGNLPIDSVPAPDYEIRKLTELIPTLEG